MADQERYYVQVTDVTKPTPMAWVVDQETNIGRSGPYRGSQAIAEALVKAKELNRPPEPPEKKDSIFGTQGSERLTNRLSIAQEGLEETVRLIEWAEATILYRAHPQRRRKDDDKTLCCLYCNRPKGQIHVAGCAWGARVAKIQDAYGRSQ